MIFGFFGSSLNAIWKEIEIAEKKKHKIDRIAWKAEAAQRLAKRGSWK